MTKKSLTNVKPWHVALTGASSGIGMALAREFSKHGHKLSLASRRNEVLEKLAQELPSPAKIYSVDLSELENAQSWIKKIEKESGEIDVLINNAGIQIVAPTQNVSISDGEKVLFLDLLAPLRMIQAVLPGMVKNNSGKIINISSMCAVNPVPGMFHYNAAKSGLAAASEGLRMELAKTGVRIITVYPGPITTPLEQAARKKLKNTFIVDRMPTGTPERLAELIYKATCKGSARVVYPSFYGSARHCMSLSQWVTEKLSPGFSE